MQLTYLGTGNAFAPGRRWSSLLVNGSVLLDAGPSALYSLKQLAVDATGIRHIFLSHFHADHCFGLPFLLLEYYFLAQTDAPLTIIGPPGVADYVRRLLALAYPEVAERPWPRPITFVDAQDGVTQTADGLTFTAVRTEHVPQVLESFGYRVQFADGLLAYSGDAALTDALWTLIDGAQVCVLEATSQEQSAVHLGLHAIRTLLARVPAGTAVLLNHLDVADAAPWRDLPVIVPEDLATYQVP